MNFIQKIGHLLDGALLRRDDWHVFYSYRERKLVSGERASECYLVWRWAPDGYEYRLATPAEIQDELESQAW